MKHFVRFLFLGLFLQFAAFPVRAQSSGTGIGDWRVYVPNHNGKMVVAAGPKIYCATEKGLFYFDKEFNSLETLTKVNGLHDMGISTMNFDSVTNTLVIAYENTNLDLIRGEEIININDILRKSLPGEKLIYNIYFKDKLAYLSCAFGLVVLDLQKLEIKDSYILRNTAGVSLKIYASTILNNQLFIATSGGIMRADNYRTVNLNDRKNWKTYGTADSLPATSPDNIRTLATFKNAVYAGVNSYGVYKLENGTWKKTKADTWLGSMIKQLVPRRSVLLVCTDYNVRFLSENNEIVGYLADGLMSKPQAVAQDRSGEFWVADINNGLVRTVNQSYSNLFPSGPADISTFKILADARSVVVLAGGYRGPGQLSSGLGFYEFKNGTWENYNFNRFKDPAKYPDILDLSAVVRNPVNGKLYMGSFGYGVLEWNGPGDFKVLGADVLSSSIAVGSPDYAKYLRVSGLAADPEGNIWVTNPSDFSGLPGLHMLRPDGTWRTFSLQNTSEGTSFGTSNTFEKIVIDDSGYKWINIRPRNGNGLVIYDDVNDRFRFLNKSTTGGNLPGNEVHSMAKDMDGDIWVGTENGIGVFYDPELAFSSSKNISASVPVFGNRALLEEQVVTVITVDGANRKWVGTENGVWLFNEDADKVILNFTTANSPLPSNKITDIAVNHATGDVYIGTEAGLASYRAGATITSETPDCANVFPNPVRPGFAGQIAISGIANNATVKITDVTGNLVFETKALGGTAIWNGRDINGQHVRSGVYLVLSSNPEGGETCVSKVAVLE
ncbi:hypothetical protein I5M27_16160 [Adhaeribacter sp. BT258]|uniref:PorZ N-terminal beta-propeller domain-containing protein n=1 Tax=Adhaeribacter terrigena TaxID=2793070 RepID=A0ABS1C563_9BACT|nr:two-component regulator propeller domain-containing protein [Adhaeribacter terrigena]MBK0404532.1 hypothetical protein [Adhaeribacter terrigena]